MNTQQTAELNSANFGGRQKDPLRLNNLIFHEGIEVTEWN